MPANQLQTYNDARLDLLSREVFHKAMEQARDMLEGKTTMNPEKLQAIASVADAAACGFDSDKESENEYD
jgi:hypothetical protein